MAKALSFVGKVAGVVATVAVLAGNPVVASIASAVAVVANTGAAIIGTPKPPILGSITDITIGANQPSPYMIGDTYSGGKMAHQTGYGPTIDKVPNPYYAMAVIHSVGGPIASIDQYLADFEPVSFTGAGWASGYYNDILYRQASLGPAQQGAALGGPFGAIPGWGANAKLSGKAHTLWSLKWDSKNGKYQGGAPQLGIRGRGVLTWDPRKDSTRPGGAGPQRWADPKNRAAFDAAKATWAYTNRPGLHALRYALGTWERDLGNPNSGYVLTFGIGMPLDGVVVEDFIDLENICEANDWTVSGVLEEPGDKAANLKRILTAGGAEICWKGGRLGLKLTVPWLPLDTITRDDIAEGAFEVPGAAAWRDRINTAVPKFRSPAHQWQVIDGAKLSVAAFVAEDGEEKPREVPLELVTDPAQAGELAAYEIWNAREQGPVALPIKPRLREYDGGDRLTLAEDLRADLGLKHAQVVVVAKRFDPVSMTGTLTIVTENAAKHPAVIGATTIFPPPTQAATAPEYDRVAVLGAISAQIDEAIEGLAGLADDGELTPFEKVTKLIPLNAELEAQWSLLDSEAAAFAGASMIDTARAYAMATRTEWLQYRNGITPPWNDKDNSSRVFRADYNTALNNYRLGIIALINGMRAYNTFSLDQVATEAEDALDQIQALANDGVLSVNEKITKLIPLDAELYNAWDLLDEQAAAITGFATVSDARATANSARLAWEAYRNSLSPAWNNTAFDTAVDRTLFNGRVADYRYGIDLIADALRKYAGLPPNQGAYKVTAIYAPGTSTPIYAPNGSSAATISMPAHDVVLSDGRRSGQDFGTFPAGTITGLNPNTSYAVFWDFVSSSYLAEAMPAPVGTSNNALIYYPPITTSSSGGGYVAPPAPPPGYRGYDGLGRGAAIP